MFRLKESEKIMTNVTTWDYEIRGPETWATLCDEFTQAAAFSYQSPIALSHAYDMTKNHQAENIEFHYQNATFHKEEINHTIHYVPNTDVNYVEFHNTRYTLTDIHFHRPSEHTINGKQEAIEFHFVHTNAKNENLVVGVLCDFTKDPNVVFIPNEETLVFDPKVFLPKKTSKFHFEGSLTTPPTKGPIQWFVFDTVQTLSEDFLKTLPEHHFTINNRPTQAINGREIYYFD